MSTELTPVVFRVWPGRDADMIALFPTIDAGDGKIMSFEHVGQHGGADYGLVIRKTRPARPSQYAVLMAELRQRGYDLKVYKRWTKRGRP